MKGEKMTKKSAIIILVSFIIVLNILVGLFQKYVAKSETQNNTVEEQNIVDNEAPTLVLKENKFVIYQGVEFNYDAFIVSATDNIDGDLKDKVQYNEVDLSKIGTYKIEYSVEDNAGNKTTEILDLIVKEDIGL